MQALREAALEGLAGLCPKAVRTSVRFRAVVSPKDGPEAPGIEGAALTVRDPRTL